MGIFPSHSISAHPHAIIHVISVVHIIIIYVLSALVQAIHVVFLYNLLRLGKIPHHLPCQLHVPSGTHLIHHPNHII